MSAEWQPNSCDVCVRLDGDGSTKWCFWCPLCQAWICEDCQHDWGRRGRASALAMAERFA